ncbi:ComEC/Rec2 family competence protein [Loktanella sp. SALINAS62]|uniref:ComEC/Rec2 family competence protein n=1 Tax=Loktanella sp. SALINAS62 TaxID=2706124 RepID=UPI002012AE41|nr:ComEC/Rec2 family competence protein [Loktanella sp. SALINAS62]
MLWLPVCLGIGIGGYFALRFEPTAAHWGGVAILCLLCLLAARCLPQGLAPLAVAVACIGFGAGLARIETMRHDAPVLGFRYYGPIAGRIVNIDRSASDAVRLTLDQVRMDRLSPDRTPLRVRLSLHGDQPLTDWQPGARIMMTGHLSPPSGPAEPGGFDFRRHAWFQSIGAVGYTRTPVLRAALPQPSATQGIFRLRMAISKAVQSRVPGDAGAFAAAIMTGDRSGISQDALDDLRASNLAHLLAISGLHMGLLTAFIFAVVRVGLSLWPAVALRVPVKKLAAVAALLAGAFYLALSGGAVATQRAYIMVAVMLLAVLVDRRALTLRAVALAATAILVLRPDAMTGPGFQMSFAATTALVVVFGLMRGRDIGPRWLRPVVGVIVSSGVAGLATAPFAAAHFNQVSHYGLIANLVSVPLMGAVIMPAAVLSACLIPLGLEGVGLWIMGLGLRWVLLVADRVSGWDGALSYVPSPGPLILPLLTLGLLWLILWRGRARWCGAVVALAAFGLWTQTTRPALLIADSGGLIGQMTPSGRAMSRATGDGFVASIWLENDGAPVPQDVAALRSGFTTDGAFVSVDLGPWQVLQVRGKTGLAALQDCAGADVIVLNIPDTTARPCLVIDPLRLRSTGAVALDLDADDRLIITTALSVSGVRPWTQGAQDDDRRMPTVISGPDQ